VGGQPPLTSGSSNRAGDDHEARCLIARGKPQGTTITDGEGPQHLLHLAAEGALGEGVEEVVRGDAAHG